MSRIARLLGAAAAMAMVADLWPARAAEVPPEDVPLLRARLLEFGVVLGNEGFQVRDGFWTGRLESDRPRRLAVNLFEGNQYWFCAAVTTTGDGPGLVLYDPQGRVVPTVAYETPGVVAAGVTAGETGRYVIELKPTGCPATDFVLLYLFQ